MQGGMCEMQQRRGKLGKGQIGRKVECDACCAFHELLFGSCSSCMLPKPAALGQGGE
jgi:hypothetical protein